MPWLPGAVDVGDEGTSILISSAVMSASADSDEYRCEIAIEIPTRGLRRIAGSRLEMGFGDEGVLSLDHEALGNPVASIACAKRAHECRIAGLLGATLMPMEVSCRRCR